MTRFKHIVRLVLSKLAAAAVMAVILSGQARADWPDRPITIIVPFAAGGTTDLLGRCWQRSLARGLDGVSELKTPSARPAETVCAPPPRLRRTAILSWYSPMRR